MGHNGHHRESASSRTVPNVGRRVGIVILFGVIVAATWLFAAVATSSGLDPLWPFDFAVPADFDRVDR